MAKLNVRVKSKKQPFKKTTIALTICCALLFVSCCVLGVFLYKTIEEMSKKNDEVASLNYRIEDIVKRHDSYYSDLEHRYDNINEKLAHALNLYDDYIVIVSSGNCYHQYGCFHSITSSGKFDVYTIAEAEKAGYTPCECIDQSKIDSYYD